MNYKPHPDPADPMVETASPPDFLATLTAAAQSQSASRPAPATVVTALLQAEKAAKQQRLLYAPDALIGQWQLRFTTGTRKMRRGGIALGKGFYIPQLVQAQIGFEPDPVETHAGPTRLNISNQLQLGGLRFRVTGPAKYLHKKNLLAFDFTQMELNLFGQRLYRGNFRGGQTADFDQQTDFDQQPIAKLPFFSFFEVTDTFIAARGRGGGLALWVKPTQS
jgi:hypothetical protein